MKWKVPLAYFVFMVSITIQFLNQPFPTVYFTSAFQYVERFNDELSHAKIILSQ